MIVCSCHGVSERVIRQVAQSGARTVREVARTCGAGSGCGGCRGTLRSLLDEEHSTTRPNAPPEPESSASLLVAAAR